MDNVFIPPHNTIAPDTVAWFPPSLWLVLLFIFSSVSCIYLGLAIIRFRQYSKGQREAQLQLKELYEASASLTQANALLKQVAQTYYTKNTTALHGKQWVDFWTDKLPLNIQQQHTATLHNMQQTLYTKTSPSINAAQFSAFNACITKGLPKFSWLTLRPKTIHTDSLAKPEAQEKAYE